MAPAPRSDAERNRRRLLDAALAAFASGGEPALETVARSAGVGIGTLYRHFGSRDGLVAALYADELDRLCDGAAALAATMPADQALRTWMGRYAEFVGTKRGMADAVRSALGADPDSRAETQTRTRDRLGSAVEGLLAAGRADGRLRTDVSSEDAVTALAAVVHGSPTGRLDRLLDLLLDGLRPAQRA